MTSEVDLDDLRRRFARDMERGIAELARLGYNAHYFHQMLRDYPADEVARRLVLAQQPSYGLWRLNELRRLDMSVEMWVLLPWYEELFHADIRRQAEDKLRLLDVNVPDELERLVRRLQGEQDGTE
jgi:hypothetical protein